MKIRVLLFLAQYSLQVLSVLLMTRLAFSLSPEMRTYWLVALAALPFLGLAELGSNNMMAKLFRDHIMTGNIKIIYQIFLILLGISTVVVFFVAYGFLSPLTDLSFGGLMSNYGFFVALIIGIILKSLGGIFNNLIYAAGDYAFDKLSRISANSIGILTLLLLANFETKIGVPITWAMQGLVSIVFFGFYYKKMRRKKNTLPESMFPKLKTFLIVAVPGILLASAPQFILNQKVGRADFENYISIMSILYGLQGLTTVFANIYGAEMLRGSKTYTQSVKTAMSRTFILSILFLTVFALVNPFYQELWLENFNFSWPTIVFVPLLLFYAFEWTQIAGTQMTMLNGETNYILQTWLGLIILISLAIFWVDDVNSFICTMFISFWIGVYPRNIANIMKNIKNDTYD